MAVSTLRDYSRYPEHLGASGSIERRGHANKKTAPLHTRELNLVGFPCGGQPLVRRAFLGSPARTLGRVDRLARLDRGSEC
jgi:hypothetical protein